MATNVDMGGDTLYVNDIVYGVTAPGLVGGTSLNTDTGAVSVTTATATATVTQSGTSFIFNRLAGSTITLPAPTVGLVYTFIVGTINTSNSYKVITSAGTVFISGSMIVNKAGVITGYVSDGTTDISVNFNGTTTGGVGIGDQFTLTCVSATEWACLGVTQGSGTLATPFATS